ncbi:MAG: type II toxin-antitoxin system YafQ family toxin [Deltaproteobacteria bacterium]|nr:type II toxin-antitoxin system YafQ family toxin [Deltaproteobacteria bacterium]
MQWADGTAESYSGLLDILIDEESILARYKEHSLKGYWAGYGDIHVKSDWSLLYRILADL